jgi:hypothetical protein
MREARAVKTPRKRPAKKVAKRRLETTLPPTTSLSFALDTVRANV